MLKNRALSTVLLAALASAAGAGTAHAAPAPAGPRPPRVPAPSGTASVPARGLGQLSDLLRQQSKPQKTGKGGTAGNARSTNWAGYAVTGGRYTSVSSNWVEPYVSCTSTGIAGFWIGLDGWGSTTVEQDGTGVDCSNGTPQQFAWWETYPANSIQVYDAPVQAGDQMSSSVDYQGGGQYVMVLTDWTEDWRERNVVSAPTAKNASAEIVAEAVTTGASITALPDFSAIGFTGSTINSGSLQSASAQPIDMTDMSDNLIATTSTADASGDFIVNYVGNATTPGTSVTSSSSSGQAGRRESVLSRLETRINTLVARL